MATGYIRAQDLPILIMELEPPLGNRGCASMRAGAQDIIMTTDIPNRKNKFHFMEVRRACRSRVPPGSGRSHGPCGRSHITPCAYLATTAAAYTLMSPALSSPSAFSSSLPCCRVLSCCCEGASRAGRPHRWRRAA